MRHDSQPFKAENLIGTWRAALIQLGFIWLGLIGLFHTDWAAMFDQWWNSANFNHILLIPLILAWLVQQRLHELSQIKPHGWWPGLIGFAAALVLWVLGACAQLAIIRQFAAVGMMIGAVLAILGPRVGAGLAFPLGFMFLLVPFGDELVPPLQMITAKITVALVHLSGIKAVIDGVFINTPAGLFEVAEACSGMKFVIAMFAFGILGAHVCFISWRRRLGFVALAIAFSILANGIRAWGTIFMAQYVGAEKAGGIDHIIYGWLFFALVIAAILALSWRFFDRPSDAPLIDLAVINNSPLLDRLSQQRIGTIPAILAITGTVLAGALWVRAADNLMAPVPKQIFLAEVPGWQRENYAPREWWEPRASGAEHRLLGRYRNKAGQTVDVFYALYASQGPGKKANGFGEGALTPDSIWSWKEAGDPVADAKVDHLQAKGRSERVAETYFRTGQVITGSSARLSMATMRSRLTLHAQPTMLLILSAEEQPGHPAAASLAAFRQSTGPLPMWMDRMAILR